MEEDNINDDSFSRTASGNSSNSGDNNPSHLSTTHHDHHQVMPPPETKKTALSLDDKKRRRLERNRESARESRRRKREKAQCLKQQISLLEADNFQIRLSLQVGPEAKALRGNGNDEITKRIQSMVEEGSSDGDLLSSINELQERYSDYGRDRRSAIDFHIHQLKRCLRPSTTTRTILWLLSMGPLFHERGGAVKTCHPGGDLATLWFDLLDTLKPTSAQLAALVELALASSQIPAIANYGVIYGHYSVTADDSSSSSSSSASSSSSSAETAALSMPENQCEAMLFRLEDLITTKNLSLDHEMSEVQRFLSANQIAKYILWVGQNPACMQMLEALWPHTMHSNISMDRKRQSDDSREDDDEEGEGGASGGGTSGGGGRNVFRSSSSLSSSYKDQEESDDESDSDEDE